MCAKFWKIAGGIWVALGGVWAAWPVFTRKTVPEFFADYNWYWVDSPIIRWAYFAIGGFVAGLLVAQWPRWKSDLRLTLTFDATLSHAAESGKKENVAFWWWVPVNAVHIRDQLGQTLFQSPGEVVVFITYARPIRGGFERVSVLGGGVICKVEATRTTQAVVRAIGDMRGKTLEMRFSSEPIPLP